MRKLEYYREGGSDKHLRDIRGMLNVSGEQIDRVALEEWIDKRGVRVQWQILITQNEFFSHSINQDFGWDSFVGFTANKPHDRQHEGLVIGNSHAWILEQRLLLG